MRDRFDKFIEWYGDMVDRGDKDCFEIDDFERFRDYILNWDFVKLAIYEENKDGVSYLWDMIKFKEGV